MKPPWLIWALLLAPAAAAAGADITAALKVAETQNEELFPYRTAELSVTNATAAAIETVILTPSGGGPSVRQVLAVAPGQTARAPAALPAIWPVQQYRLTALNAAGEPLGSASAGITWPAEIAATDAFIDDAFAPWRDAAAGWPAGTRRNAILLLAIFVTALAGALFVRRPWARAAAAVALAAGAAVLVFHVPGWPPAVDAAEFHLLLSPPGGPVTVDSFAVLAARRTARIQRRAYRAAHPVYPDRKAALGDSAEATPAERSIRLTVRRGEVRILRPARQRPWVAGTPVFDSPLREVDGVVQVDAAFPYRPGFALRDDALWVLPPARGRGPTPLSAETSRSVWEIVSQPDRYRLTRQHARLFAYWRAKYQRGGGYYLLGFERRGRHFVLAVAEAAVAPATQPSPSAE